MVNPSKYYDPKFKKGYILKCKSSAIRCGTDIILVEVLSNALRQDGFFVGVVIKMETKEFSSYTVEVGTVRNFHKHIFKLYKTGNEPKIW